MDNKFDDLYHAFASTDGNAAENELSVKNTIDLYNLEEPIAEDRKEKQEQYDRFLNTIPKSLANIQNVLSENQKL